MRNTALFAFAPGLIAIGFGVWAASPANAPVPFADCAEGGECNLIVLHAGDVLHDAFAVRRPGVSTRKVK